MEDKIREIIKGMFESGEIKVNVRTEADYSGTNITTRVYIEDEEVWKEEESLRIF